MINKKIKLILSILFLSFLTACAGTGTKLKPTVSTDSSGVTNLYFVRSSGFVAGGILSKIEVNGQEIAKLGVKEYVKHQTSSNFKIKISGSGISGMTMGTDSASGVADSKNYFYIIGVKQGLFSAKFTIQETTETGFNQAL
jgi:hypothetical protein